VSQSTTAPVRPSLFEALAAASLLGLAAVAVLVTYARIEPGDLYHVSEEGLAGGLGRTLVLVNYPIALVAIAVAAIAADRLDDPRADALALFSILLCGLVAVPGVVDQDDLDARLVNLLPAFGVGLAAGLAAAALHAGGVGAPARRAFGDPLRIGVAAALLILAIPWYFAEAGFYGPDPILADEVPAGETIAAVHLGHHHGTDGVLLGLAALALSRTLGTHRRRRAEAFVSGYLALMLAYGCALAIEDDWGEQVWKRGWTDWDIPNVLRPELSLAWAVIVAAAVGVELLWFRRARTR
jgi:amino acid transporter